MCSSDLTALVVATILVPQLETFCKTKEQRLAAGKETTSVKER